MLLYAPGTAVYIGLLGMNDAVNKRDTRSRAQQFEERYLFKYQDSPIALYELRNRLAGMDACGAMNKKTTKNNQTSAPFLH